MPITTPVANAGAGLMFRETMSGGFALEESDPAAGARHRTSLVLHAALTIADVEAFVRDATHAGTIDASISFAPLRMNLLAASGVFRLFTRTEDPSLKRMEYVVTARRGTEVYCLSGAKEVRRGSPFRGWRDTTTLPCRLHEGTDDRGPVVGAGILRISAAGFARQLASFRAVNGASAGARARALVRFHTFFAGELVDSYLWPTGSVHRGDAL